MIYQVSNKNRLLVFLLCMLILFNAFFFSVEKADASVTLTAGTLAVLGSALIASGFVFQNADNLSQAARSLWNSLSDSQKEFFVSAGVTYGDYVTSGEPYVVKLSSDICSTISSWLRSCGALASSSSVAVPFDYTDFSTSDLSASNILRVDDSQFPATFAEWLPTAYRVPGIPFYVTAYFGTRYSDYYKDTVYTQGLGVYLVDSKNNSLWNMSLASRGGSSYETAYFSSFDFGACKLRFSYNATAKEWTVTRSYSYNNFSSPKDTVISTENLSSDFSGTVSIPWTGGYAPGYGGTKELDDSTGIVVPGKLVEDGAIDSDFVGTLTPDSVRETSSDTSTDVATDGILDWVKSIARTLENFFDVSEFSLDFSPFEIGLSKVFPFCIPFDFYNGVKLFSATAADFSFDINLDTDYFKIAHTVDLTPFKLPILFFRYIVVFWFSWILISRTRDLMKW